MKSAGLLFTIATSANSAPINLDAVNFMGGPRLLITASPTGSDGTKQAGQKLLLDTGSSTLAFCDASLADKVKSEEAGYYSCNIYGNAQVKEGYWGPFYKGNVQINGNIEVPDSHFAIMKQQKSMPCTQGVQGIFGIAFHQLDAATSTKPDWPANGVGSCTRPSTDFVEPMMQLLNGKGGVKKLGIHWSGKQGDGEGHLYLDDDAESNSHYDAGKAASVGKAALGTFGWYDITVQSVNYNSQSYTDITCNPQQGSPCIMDTGTPVLVVPQGAYQAMVSGKTGTMSVKLAGQHFWSKSVTLNFDVKTLLANNWVEPGAGGVILGLPLRAFYYSVMDISEQTVSFVPVPAYHKAESTVSDVVV